jgi:hypothetical protein
MFNEVITQFIQLHRALIDTSSIIYLDKIGIFDTVSQSIGLYTLPEIMDEIGFQINGIKKIECHDKSLSNDQKLLSSARRLKYPLISEDKKILLSAKNAGIEHFNTLMIINVLVYKGKLNPEQASFYFDELKKVARYSKSVWDLGLEVYSGIIKNRNR